MNRTINRICQGTALLELEHRFGKTVRDQVEKMGFVIPKTGRWSVNPIYIKCSECGEAFMLIPQNYCPNCGAKMVNEDEQTD